MISNGLSIDRRAKFSKRMNKVSPYLFILPFLIFFITFSLLPVLLSIGISFLKWDFIGDPEFVGFDNYSLIFDPESLTHEKFFNALSHTLLFVAVQTPILIILPLLIAILLNTKLKGHKIYRGFIYFPAILSVSTVATVFFVLLDTNIGIINVFSGEETPWLTAQPYQWISIFLMSTWWGIGGNMIYYTAGLQNISPDLYEAAHMDGAGIIGRLIHVTLPGLKDTFVYVIVMTILSTFNVMGQPMMLTAGEESTEVSMQYIYSVAFGGLKFGRATAMSLVMTVIMAVFSIASFKLVLTRGGKDND